MKKWNFLISMVLFFLFLGCSKEKVVDDVKSSIEGSKLKGGYVVTPQFDWQNGNTVEYKGMPILLPWIPGANSFISTEWFNDYYVEDGWSLVYNNFPNSNAHPTFILYNKYTGQLRVFYYAGTNIGTPGNLIFFGLKVAGNGNMLNFEKSIAYAADYKENNQYSIKSGEFLFSNVVTNAGFAPGNWYGAQFELSYDPSIPNYKDIDHLMSLYIFDSQIDSIDIAGTQNGDIKGTVSYNTTGGSLISNLNFDLKSVTNAQTTNALIYTATNNMEQAKSSNPGFFNKLVNKISVATGTAFNNGVESFVKNVVTQGVNWATNPISTFVNSIIGSSTKQNIGKVDLKLSTKIKLKGTIKSNNPITNTYFVIPGTSLSGNGGSLPPDYGQNYFGVWTMDKTPVINKTSKYYIILPASTDGEYSFHDYELNNFNIIINPNLSNDFVVEDLKKVVVFKSENVLGEDEYEPFSWDNGSYLESSEGVKIFYPKYDIDPLNHGVKVFVAFTLKNTKNGKKFHFTRFVNFQLNISSKTKYVKSISEIPLPY